MTPPSLGRGAAASEGPPTVRPAGGGGMCCARRKMPSLSFAVLRLDARLARAAATAVLGVAEAEPAARAGDVADLDPAAVRLRRACAFLPLTRRVLLYLAARVSIEIESAVRQANLGSSRSTLVLYAAKSRKNGASVIDTLVNLKIRLDSVRRMTQIQNTS